MHVVNLRPAMVNGRGVRGNMERITHELGWQPCISLNEGLRELLTV